MKRIVNYLKSIKKEVWIRNSFLIPILSVVGISIAHVITWYELGNPMAWAIYLSVAIEIFALASVSAASIKIKKNSIWFLFGIVTLIQIIGNVFFIYQFINIQNETFLSWVELITPWFDDWTLIDHKRLLAIIQGGTLPFMSLIALHFYIKFNDKVDINTDGNEIEEVLTVDTSEEEITHDKVDLTDTNDEKVEPEKVEPEKVEPEKVEPEKVEPEKVEPEKVTNKEIKPVREKSDDLIPDKSVKDALRKDHENESSKETDNIVKSIKKSEDNIKDINTPSSTQFAGGRKNKNVTEKDKDNGKDNGDHPQIMPGVN